MNPPSPHRAARGYTLVETMVVCAIAGIVTSVALPTYQAQIVKSRRADAVQALEGLRRAQDRHRDVHGRYAGTLAELKLSATSPVGLYALTLEVDAAGRYRARATPAGDAQAGDTECNPLTLAVDSGFARPGPSRRCWNR